MQDHQRCHQEVILPYPGAVAYGPMEHGGMEFPDSYTLQDQLQIPNTVRVLRIEETVANDFLVTLSNMQLASGFVKPILECTGYTINQTITWVLG